MSCTKGINVANERSTATVLGDMYERLLARFGPRNWWPADSPFEVCVGAVLTQNTAWRNVVKAIDNLKDAAVLDPFSIHALEHHELAGLIQPAGYYNVKAKRLRNFVDHLVDVHSGDISSLLAGTADALRLELLTVNGIGKETADSMILYAAEKPVFVVDAYTKRVLERHGLIEEGLDYDRVQALFHDNLTGTAHLYNDFHAQFVAVGHNYCKKKPRCDECPLAGFG